ncbi:hypothetical protein H206_05159 [Candidatus Electrothrix aarhusensis]|uniref:Uncharacterized protein n=1 Tax=Candidatus Electrothrix aarhusensis TaxID=1859131 RepID=A0A444J5B1_9BACT|nr:hypothetical protein H206_05159 [Candidatus Electrothrix aarhusensis]
MQQQPLDIDDDHDVLLRLKCSDERVRERT